MGGELGGESDRGGSGPRSMQVTSPDPRGRLGIHWTLGWLTVNPYSVLQAVVRDISVSMRIQREFERALRKSEAAAAAKSNFIEVMSHGIWSLIDGIIRLQEDLLTSTLGFALALMGLQRPTVNGSRRTAHIGAVRREQLTT